MKDHLSTIFRSRTRDEWSELMEGSDVCFAPVLSMAEAAAHPHNVARQSFVDVAGITQPAPSPRFSRTEAVVQRPPAHAGQHTDEILSEWLDVDPDPVVRAPGQRRHRLTPASRTSPGGG